MAVRRAAAGGHPDPVAGSWLHGARPRDVTASRSPHSVQFSLPSGEGRRDKGSARQFAFSPQMRVRSARLSVQRLQRAATLTRQEAGGPSASAVVVCYAPSARCVFNH